MKRCTNILCSNTIEDHRKFCSFSCNTKFQNLSRDYVELGRLQSKPLRDKYEKSPKFCLNCLRKIEYERRENTFCNRSCSSSFNNRQKNNSLDIDLVSYSRYYDRCSFKFNIEEFSDKIDLSILRERGWYRSIKTNQNLEGVVRDHRFSVLDGFKNKVDPEIISHPANCQLLTNRDNILKSSTSSITLDELIYEIINF